MIKKDFPTLTEDELKKNIDLIDEYYAQNIDYIVLYEIANNGQEIENKVAQRTSKALSKNGNRAWCILKNYQSPWNFLVPPGFDSFTGSFSYTLSSIALLIASDQAETTSKNYYGDLGESNTRRDAYRHITWSALLAQHYFTVSSKVKRLKFSEAVTYANEYCGENPIDGREMDYHNNAIGRKIWDDNTSYRKTWFGWIYALNRSSVSKLKRISREYVNKKSCLIAKNKINESPYNLLARNQTPAEIQAKILNTNTNTVVYFEGEIAPSWYQLSFGITHYEYIDCEDGGEEYEVEINGEILCRMPVYGNTYKKVNTCYKL